MTSRIFYTKPSITEKEVKYATDAARYGWGEHCYEYINRFEELFKQHLGREICRRHIQLHRRAPYGPGRAGRRPGGRSDSGRYQLDRQRRAYHISRRKAGVRRHLARYVVP